MLSDGFLILAFLLAQTGALADLVEERNAYALSLTRVEARANAEEAINCANLKELQLYTDNLEAAYLTTKCVLDARAILGEESGPRLAVERTTAGG